MPSNLLSVGPSAIAFLVIFYLSELNSSNFSLTRLPQTRTSLSCKRLPTAVQNFFPFAVYKTMNELSAICNKFWNLTNAHKFLSYSIQ